MPASKNVLIVEDEPLIVMMLESFLEALDHVVAGSADTVADALALIETVPIDVAILDMNLRNGDTSAPVAEALARKGIPFIVASGGGLNDGLPPFQGHPRLPKPFTISSLENALDSL